MTVVAALADPVSNTAILVADSRVTALKSGEHWDVCQKVAWLGNEGVFGFAGPVGPAGEVSRRITRTYRERGTDWLTSRDDVLAFLEEIDVPGKAEVAFVAAFRNRGHVRIARFSADGEYEIKSVRTVAIGTGSEAAGAVGERYVDLLNFGGAGQTGIALAQRALLYAEWITQEARKTGITSVGGLMQVYLIDSERVMALPYHRWVDVASGYGTYVTMDFDGEGAWVQAHEGTGLRVPLRHPAESDFMGAAGSTGTTFELETRLTPESPGVEPRPMAVTLYQLFRDASGQPLVRTTPT